MIAPARPMASVPTGMPAGIWTIDSRLSMPLSAFDSTGTPNTGSGVIAAVMPGRCAAPPAPAMITLRPRPLADLAYSASRSGVRCAETMRVSCAMPSASSVCAACVMVAQSDWLPMIMPMRAPAVPEAIWRLRPAIPDRIRTAAGEARDYREARRVGKRIRVGVVPAGTGSTGPALKTFVNRCGLALQGDPVPENRLYNNGLPGRSERFAR